MGVFGAYGKIPSLGDFFRIDASSAFVAPWDVWLQTCLRDGRLALGDRWEECYFGAPIWRFSLAAGIAGPSSIAGVLMPSVDRVGRMFPLTLVGSALRVNTDIFAQLEEVALATLEDGMTRDALRQALDDVAETAPTLNRAADNLWEAVLEGRMLGMSLNTLPTGGDALKLFDPNLWQDTSDAPRQVGL